MLSKRHLFWATAGGFLGWWGQPTSACSLRLTKYCSMKSNAVHQLPEIRKCNEYTAFHAIRMNGDRFRACCITRIYCSNFEIVSFCYDIHSDTKELRCFGRQHETYGFDPIMATIYQKLPWMDFSDFVPFLIGQLEHTKLGNDWSVQ